MKTLLEVVTKIRNEGPHAKSLGICACISNWIPDDDDQMIAVCAFQELVVKWEHFSGRVQFPIPHRKKMRHKRNPSIAFWNTENLWDKRTAYGRLRWELVDFLIDKLTQSATESAGQASPKPVHP